MNLADLFSREDRPALEKWCRQQTQQCYLGDNTALCRVLGKYLMYVDTRDQSLSPHLLMNGFWEMWVTIAIARYVKPGMTAIDVGANVGYYTLLLSDLVGEQGCVASFEPQARLCQLMNDSLKVSGLRRDKQQVAWNAVGAGSGYVPFLVHESSLGSGSVFKGDPGQLRAVSEIWFSVERCSVDAGLRHRDLPVDFVKIDVQGDELEVLRGMKETLARSPDIAIAMEFTPVEHADPAEALREIREQMGLRIQTIGTDGTVRPVSIDQAASPDTGDHRMLWLTREA